MTSIVSIVRAEPETAKSATEESIELINGLQDVVGKRNVTIKPNLCRPCSPLAGYTTDPAVVEGVIERINGISQCNIRVVETNNSEASADETFRKLGYLDLQHMYPNVKCANLSTEGKLRISLGGRIFQTLQIPESMLFSDYLVSVAKLKTHADYCYTGVLKNAYGFVLSRQRRQQYHGFMHEALTDLNTVYKPDLAIIDGMVGMEGFGPAEGEPKHAGVIIASKDPVAADAVAAEIAGIRLSKIKYLKYAEKNGLGETKDIEIVGSSIEEVKTSFNFIPLRWYLLGKMSLSIQRNSRRLSNLGRVLGLTRSAMSTIGYSELRNRLSLSDLMRLARDTTFKIED